MGVLRYEFYSKLLGKQIRLCMVLPEQAHAGKLPDATLYLLHGGGGNAEEMCIRDRSGADSLPPLAWEKLYSSSDWKFIYAKKAEARRAGGGLICR